MVMLRSKSKPLGKGDRVVVVRDLVGIPEGTRGRIEVVSGLTWIRYWVQLDDGTWHGTIDEADVVGERDWPAYRRERAEAEARAAEEALRPPAPAAAADDDGAAADTGAAADSRIPAHILERSRAARARVGG
jgi:hypothetical protein